MMDKKEMAEPAAAGLREAVADAIAFWEIWRFGFNAIPICVMLAYGIAALPGSSSMINADSFLGLFVLTILTNIGYSTVYLPDIAIQLSDFRHQWMRWRWVIALVLVAIASLFARSLAIQTLH